MRKGAFVSLGLAALLMGCGGDNGDGDGFIASAIVYAMTNDAAGNQVVAWRAGGSGELRAFATYSTNGNGTGTTETPLAGPNDGIDPLGSQGSLFLTPDQNWLFAVNAGSNTVTVFSVAADGSLTRTDTESTRGTNPVSVGVRFGRVYVANVNDPTAAQASTLEGFLLNEDTGELTYIDTSTRTLSAAGARPSQVGFRPDGTQVIVTERETNMVTAFDVAGDGTLNDPQSVASPRPAPFGFDFSTSRLVVAEAAPGAESSATSYALTDNAPSVVQTVLNGQSASCWVTMNDAGDRAFVSNTGSNTVSTYALAADGTLTLRQAAVPTDGAGSAPTDADASDTMFFQLLGAKGTIAVYSIGVDGDLTLLGVRDIGLPTLGAQGLAVKTL